MPLPKITSQIIAASIPVEDGWSLLSLADVPRATASKNGESMNYFFDFMAVAGPNDSTKNKDRRITLIVNTAALEAGIAEICAVYQGLMAAFTGVSTDELVDKEINEELLVGKQVWALIQTEVGNDGITRKKFKAVHDPSMGVPY